MDSPEIIIPTRRKYALWKPISKALPRNHSVFGAYERKLTELVTRAADSSTTSPIVPQPLSPEVIPIFVSEFPLFDMIEKVPSNGLSHTYQQQTAFSQSSAPHTISESGAVSDDTNTYLRKTSNVAVFGVRRGISLKGQYAGANAGGPADDLMGRELKGGLQTIARDAQNETLRYQETVSAVTYPGNDPNGDYDANGYNGLRFIANQAMPAGQNFAVDIRTPWTDQRVLKAVRNAVNAVYDQGGKIDLLIATTRGSEALFEDQLSITRIIAGTKRLEIVPGFSVRVIDTDQGEIPVMVVPGNSVGSYTTNGTNEFVDMLGVWTEAMEMPYLGNPEPSVLRIPTGVDGTLRELAIPFAMYGLAYMAPQYMFRVQLQTA